MDSPLPTKKKKKKKKKKKEKVFRYDMIFVADLVLLLLYIQ